MYKRPKSVLFRYLQAAALGAVVVPTTTHRWVKAEKVVLVHQPGKVASKSITATIRKAAVGQVWVGHVHRTRELLLPPAGEFYKQRWSPQLTHLRGAAVGLLHYLNPSKPLTLVSCFRDPVERNLSAFLQNPERYLRGQSEWDALAGGDAVSLAEIFVQRFDHIEQQRWFETELVEGFDVDLRQMDQTFDSVGVCRGRFGNVELVLLRFDKLDQGLVTAVQHLFGTDQVPTSFENTRFGGPFEQLAQALTDQVRLDQSLLDEIYGGELVGFLFTEDERSVLRDRWAHGVASTSQAS